MLLAGIIVVLSIGIVIAGVPYLPQPAPFSITSPVSHQIRPGNQTYPGYYALTLSNAVAHKYAVGVTATGGDVNLCVTTESVYFNWLSYYNITRNPGTSFPWSACLTSELQTSQTTLTFVPNGSGNLAIVALNANPVTETLLFSPA